MQSRSGFVTIGADSVITCPVPAVIEGGVDPYVRSLTQSVGACNDDVALVEVPVG